MPCTYMIMHIPVCTHDLCRSKLLHWFYKQVFNNMDAIYWFFECLGNALPTLHPHKKPWEQVPHCPHGSKEIHAVQPTAVMSLYAMHLQLKRG